MEEQYLREESNMRLSILYSHSNTTITFVITIWSAIVALISVFHERFQGNLKWLTFIIPLIFLITSFYILFAAQKFRENLTQINKIATYYACFYNTTLSKATTSMIINSWEYSTIELQVASIRKKSKSQKVLTKMNGEYIFFSLVSMIIEMIITGSGLYFWRTEANLLVWILVYTIILAGINIYLICRIYTLTSLSHITEQKLSLMYDWIEYGQKKGVFSKKDVRERFGTILDAYQKMIATPKHSLPKSRKTK